MVIPNSLTNLAAASIIPSARVWIRSSSIFAVGIIPAGTAATCVENERCIFGKSVFDALGTTSSTTSDIPEYLYYDRRLIDFMEDAGQSTADTKSIDTSELDNVESNQYRVLLSPSQESVKSSGDSDKSNSHTKMNNHKLWKCLPLGRARAYAPFGATACPATIKPLPNHVHKPYTQLAVVGLVLDDTCEHVLLTRRPSYMRSFPGAWVLPGGGYDASTDPTIQHALEREIREEVGIHLWGGRKCDDDTAALKENKIHLANNIQPLCLWESCYPNDPSAPGPIKGHYLVVYHKAVVPAGAPTDCISSLPKIKLQEQEVDCALWLSVADFQQVLGRMKQHATANEQSEFKQDPLPPVAIHKADGNIVQGSLSTLVGIYPQPEKKSNPPCSDDKKASAQEWCGIALGSLFALEELLRESNKETTTGKQTWLGGTTISSS